MRQNPESRPRELALRAGWAAGQPVQLGALGWLRLSARLGALVLAIIVLVPLHLLWRALRYGSPLPMMFLRFAAFALGARVRRHGTPLRRNVMFLANHVSWLDILALGGATGCAFVAKTELAQAPLVGWLAKLNRTLFVSREDRMGIAEQINALREAMDDAWSVTIFPEGTVTDGFSLLPFKSSMLRVLEPPPPGIMVQPVVLDYGAFGEWIGWVGNEGGVDNGKRVLGRRGFFWLDIYFLEPFDPHDYPGRKAIAAECRTRIEARLTELHGVPLRPFAYDVAPVRYVAAAGAGAE